MELDEFPVETETAVAEPSQEEAFKRLKTNEGKLWLLYETAKRHQLNFEKPPEVPAEVVEGAMKQAFDHKEFRIAFGLAQAYGLLERVIDEIKKIPMGKPDWYCEDQFFGPTYRVDQPYKLKMALVEQVLGPARRLEEAAELLFECDRKRDALDTVARISVDRAVQLCEQDQDERILELGLSLAREHKREDLEAKLKRAHVDALLKSGWKRAPETAERHGFSAADVEGVRVSALERGLDEFEKGAIEPHNIDHTIDWSRISISKLSLALRERYQQRLLDILSSKGKSHEEMETAAEFGLYDRSFSVAMRLLRETKDEARQKALDFSARLIEKLDTGKQADREKAWEYVLNILTFVEARYVHEIARKFRIDERLLDEYERRNMFGSAGDLASQSFREEIKRRAKDLYIKAGNFYCAIMFTDNPEEKSRLYLLAADDRLKNPGQNAYYKDVISRVIEHLRDAIKAAKDTPDLKKPIAVAGEAVKVLAKNGYYCEAALFARELGIEDVRIPRKALADYERQRDFARCAIVAQALGRKRDIQMYTSLAAFANQKVPEKVDDFWAEERR